MRFFASFLLLCLLLSALYNISAYRRHHKSGVHVSVEVDSGNDYNGKHQTHLGEDPWDGISEPFEFSEVPNYEEASAYSAVATNGGQKIPFTSCGNRAVTIKSITVSPGLPLRSHGLVQTITISGTNKNKLDSGYIHVKAKAGFFNVMDENIDIPQNYLPLKAGPFTLSKTIDIPSAATMFGGMDVQASIQVYDSNGNEILCANFNVKI